MTEVNPLDHITVVLVEPQDSVNIGNILRAMMNMGVSSLRLVDPTPPDRELVAISARRAAVLFETAEVFSSLDEALQDTVLSLGCTARQRKVKVQTTTPRAMASRVIDLARDERVALVFGREDRGLSNDDLDRCDQLLVIPSSAAYPSLNLAQAVVVTLYELFMSAQTEPFTPKAPKRPSPLANRREVDGMLGQIRATLDQIGFFRFDQALHVMRSLSEIFARAALDRREAMLVRGIFQAVAQRFTASAERPS